MTTPNVSAVCFIEQCDRPSLVRGLCERHYKKRESFGLPRIKDNSLATRFWKCVTKKGANECWEWIGYSHRGYGLMGCEGRTKRATHVSLYLHHGKWPTLHVLHSCDNPPCVNPAHLSEGTHRQNMREAADRFRLPQGERRNFAKLTDEQASQIRQRSKAGESLASLSREFQVSFQSVWRIREGITWNIILNTSRSSTIGKQTRLTPPKRAELKRRALNGEALNDLAKEFDVSFTTAWKIGGTRRRTAAVRTLDDEIQDTEGVQ